MVPPEAWVRCINIFSFTVFAKILQASISLPNMMSPSAAGSAAVAEVIRRTALSN